MIRFLITENYRGATKSISVPSRKYEDIEGLNSSNMITLERLLVSRAVKYRYGSVNAVYY